MNDAPSRVTRRSTLAVIGAASAAAGLATVGRLATAGSQSPRPSDDALVVDDKGNVGIGKVPGPDALLDVGGKIKSGSLAVTGPLTISGNNTLEFGAGGEKRTQYREDLLWHRPPEHCRGGEKPDESDRAIFLHCPAGLTVEGPLKMSQKHYLELGAGIAKHADAGKIGYKLLSSDGLDIIGAGENTTAGTAGARKIKLWAEGGLTVEGPLKIPGNNYLEFGAALTKQARAGKIGYKLFGDGLDIVGAGQAEDFSDQKIALHAHGGVAVTGPILMDGFIGENDGKDTSGIDKHAEEWRLRYVARAVLAPAPKGTFILFLTSSSEDNDLYIAFKKQNGEIWTHRLYAVSGTRHKL